MAIKSSDLPKRLQAEVHRQMASKPFAHSGGAMSDTVWVVLPLPGKALKPNSRTCWQAKSAAVKRYRACSAVNAAISLAGKQPRWDKATIQATFCFAQKRRRDGDNLLASLKPAFDGLVDAGLLADDSGVTHLPVIQQIDRDNPRVVLTVTKGAVR